MKIKIFYILILIALAGILTPTLKLNALGPCPENQDLIGNNCVPKGSYQLLAPLPNPDGTPLETFNPADGLGAYLNLMITIIIGLAAVLSVVMIVIGGLEYMTSELVHSKEAGKEKIIHAILGLLIALGAYALLFTINPDLLKSDANVPNSTDSNVQVTPVTCTPNSTDPSCAFQVPTNTNP